MLLWDSLFLVLVLAPAVTGGAWWHAPHFHVEYTEPGAACAALAAWLWYRGEAERSFAYRTGARAWSRWKILLEEKAWAALGGAWLLVSAAWFLTSWLRHRALRSGLADLGIFTNAIYNVNTFGHPVSSLKNDVTLLADHQDFLVFPLGWIFPLWPSPVFLLLLQSLGLAAGGVALYLLGRQRLGPSHRVVPWLPFAYWLAGPLRAAARFDFHPEVFLLPLFLFAVFFLQERPWTKRLAGLALFLAALAAKESAGPVACGIGLAWLLGAGPPETRQFTRVAGALAIALGAGAFVLGSWFLLRHFGVTYAYSDVYAPLPTSLLGLAFAPFTQPGVFFSRLFSWSRAKFLFGCLLPTAFLPFLTPAAVAALPGFLMLFLTNGEQRISLGYHYAIEPMTGLFLALPAALALPALRGRERSTLVVLAVAGMLSVGRTDPFYWRTYRATAHEAWLRDEVLPRVPQERSVAASSALVPQIASRSRIYPLGWLGSPRVDCVLIDLSVNNTPSSSIDLLGYASAIQGFGYEPELRCGPLMVYRAPKAGVCLAPSVPACPETP